MPSISGSFCSLVLDNNDKGWQRYDKFLCLTRVWQAFSTNCVPCILWGFKEYKQRMESKVLLKDVAIQFAYPRCPGSNGMIGLFELGMVGHCWTKRLYIYIFNDMIYIYQIYIYIHICPYDMIYVRCIHVICIQSCIVYRHLNHTWHIMFVQGIAINKKACDSSQRVQFWTVWTGNECFLKVDRGIFSQSSSPTVWD